MISVVAPLTLQLAKALGVYFIAAGVAGLIMPRRYMEIVDGLRRDPTLIAIAAAATFALGAAILIAHNLWTDPLAIAVTLCGWGAALKGLVLLVAPDPYLRMAARMVEPRTARIFALAGLILGLVLLIAGLLGRAGAV